MLKHFEVEWVRVGPSWSDLSCCESCFRFQPSLLPFCCLIIPSDSQTFATIPDCSNQVSGLLFSPLDLQCNHLPQFWVLDSLSSEKIQLLAAALSAPSSACSSFQAIPQLFSFVSPQLGTDRYFGISWLDLDAVFRLPGLSSLACLIVFETDQVQEGFLRFSAKRFSLWELCCLGCFEIRLHRLVKTYQYCLSLSWYLQHLWM